MLLILILKIAMESVPMVDTLRAMYFRMRNTAPVATALENRPRPFRSKDRLVVRSAPGNNRAEYRCGF